MVEAATHPTSSSSVPPLMRSRIALHIKYSDKVHKMQINEIFHKLIAFGSLSIDVQSEVRHSAGDPDHL